jgi:hypothetical protein
MDAEGAGQRHTSRTGKQSWPLGQSVVRRHWTQAPASQTGLSEGQSLFARHCTHVLSLAQSFPVWVVQSALPTHSTQAETVVLQTGVAPEHCVLSVQPGMHVKVLGLQMGFATPQSALSRHATHLPVGPKQRGEPEAQSESPAHATHWFVVSSQSLLVPVQSVAWLQPTQAPTAALQTGVALGQPDASWHAVWHWWSPGQHDGEAAGQSAFVAQAPHCPVLVTQIGEG